MCVIPTGTLVFIWKFFYVFEHLFPKDLSVE